jgi:glycosyltransferase involved in cell wall biosynthesis
MRILIPILGFAPQGGYRVLSELANAWIRMGHECNFLVPSTSKEPYFPTTAKVIKCDFNGIISVTNPEKKENGVDNLVSLFMGLNKIGEKYDVILGNHCLTSWVVRWVECGKAIKFYYIQAYEPGYYPWYKDPVKHLLAKFSYKLNLRKIANSETYKNNGVTVDAIIPPGIDLEKFWEKKNNLDLSEKPEIVIGTLGRVEPYKGTATAISAFRKLRSVNKKLQMKVAFGNVNEADDLEIIKIQGDRELANFYRSLDVLIVSCYSQHGAPHYPLIESMACGTPVVHTDYYPGTAENSWKANSPNAEDVATALEQLLATPYADMMKKISNARKTVEEKLSWDSVAMSFIYQFESLNSKL